MSGYPGYSEQVWDAVKAMWMAGNSAHSIANKEGMPSKQAICERVKSDGWERVDVVDQTLEVIPFDGLSHEQQIAVTKIAEGMPHRMAAAFAGVHPGTISAWLKDDPNFLKARDAAIAVKTQRRLSKIEKAEDYRASIWLLERDKDTRDDYAAPKPTAPPLLPHLMFNVLGQVQVGMDRVEKPEQPVIEHDAA